MHVNIKDLGLAPDKDACPCNRALVPPYISSALVPPYISSDYYCETANNIPSGYSHHLYSNDTLWDRQQCVGGEAPCCTNPNMPWFLKKFNETTTENIELRVCDDEGTYNEDTLLQVIEFFVY